MNFGDRQGKWVVDEVKVPDACGLSGFINLDGKRIGGEIVRESMSVMRERGNGLGGGYAGYGIYPDFKEHFAFHVMFEDDSGRRICEELLREYTEVEKGEGIPTRQKCEIVDPPILMRYFLLPKREKLESENLEPDDFIVQLVMKINTQVPGSFVFSSGKNMGIFKAVGFPEDVADFYKLESYTGYTWIGHGRFPTNTPGWWGGAHPFNILDWSVVHNGEISSYGINKRYLEMFGYKCTLLTDTEVMAYLFDLLIRRHGLPIEVASKVVAAPFWEEIDQKEEGDKLEESLRMVYGSALVNGPFAVIVGFSRGMFGLNDRVKLRPLVAAVKDETLYVASEEAAIRQICNRPDNIWAPPAGEPVIGRLKGDA
ncbi:MAG: glutamine amidotransferase family protein [Actinomycetota bacterium]|nr:glutamine amidotransferase family protein [Actinomycetota bacterium]